MSSSRRGGPADGKRRPPARKRLTDEEREQIADAIRAGRPRNEIARAFDRSQGTVSRIARQAGLSFDRAITKEATDARATDNAHRLEVLKGRFLIEAEAALDELRSKASVHKILPDGDIVVHEVDSPTFGDKRNIMWRAGGAIRNYLEIDSHQGGGEDSFAAVDQWLDAMVGDE
jgi:transposase-like protein